MVKLKLSIFDQEKYNHEWPVLPGETLENVFVKAALKVTEGKLEPETVNILVNGNLIDRDLWPMTKLRENDEVFIAPKIEGDGGTGSSLLRTALIVAGTIYLGGLGAAAFGVAGATTAGAQVAAGLITATASIISTLAAFALFPPADPNLGEGGSQGESQTYTISGQSNGDRRLKTVPKVYGTHRFFPPIAANPYTTFKVDSVTKQVVQYFTAIYDFGLGLMQIQSIQIGETPITNFQDFSYRLVDVKRGTNSTQWDNQLADSFQIYFGSGVSDSTNVNIVNGQELIRNVPPNTNGTPQQITLEFAAPRGMYAYNSAGTLGGRSAVFRVEVSKVNENNWLPYNDGVNFVVNSATGGALTDKRFWRFYLPTAAERLSGNVAPMAITDPASTYNLVLGYPPGYQTNRNDYFGVFGNRIGLGLTSDMNYLPLENNQPIPPVGTAMYVDEEFMGNFVSAVPSGTHTKYYLDRFLRFNGIKNAFSSKSLYFYINWGFYGVSAYESEYGSGTLPNAGRVQGQVIVPARFTIERTTLETAYAILTFTPIVNDNYKIRIRREFTNSVTSDIATNNQFTVEQINQIFSLNAQDEISFLGVKSRFQQAVVETDKRHVFLELEIKATDQLNGAIQNLSAICTSVLDVWDGTQWVKQPTSNPAWVFVDLLTGEVNKNAISKDRLHLPSIMEWAAFCDEIPPLSPTGITYGGPRFTCNFILDFDTTLQNIVNQVCNAAQASLSIIDGKYGVLIDKLKTVPVQIFTPRNSSNFKSVRSYREIPDAINVKYIDPALAWETTELTVYNNGFDQSTAVKIQDTTAFACTDYSQAYRYGRYLLAQARLRQELITIDVDFEYLVCARGDYVKITQDAMKVGGYPGRVISKTGNQIKIDDGIETSNLLSYGYTFRASDGQIYTSTLVVNSSDTFTLAGSPLPNVGDLIVIGEVSKITFDCIVKSITPSDDFSATLTLVEKADGVYSSEYDDVFPIYDPQLSENLNSEFAPPAEVTDLRILESSFLCASGGGYQYYIDLDWDVPVGSAYEAFEVYVNNGRGYTQADIVRDSTFRYLVEARYLGVEHQFKVVAVSATGKKLDLGAVSPVTQTPLKKSTPAPNVESLAIDITNEVLQLSWPAVTDCVDQYLIRYTPNVTSPSWEASIPFLRADSNQTVVSGQARTGSYLIKAIDYEGNESATATIAITTIPNLFNLNVVDETTDFPAILGIKDQVESDGVGLILRKSVIGDVFTTQFFSVGYYYYQNFLDLTEIYTVRLQSLIQAEGYTLSDVMANWNPLSSVLALSSVRQSEWDVRTEYRATNSLNVIADWATLSSINPISEGDQDAWTPWREFVMGDATGRIFQFRLKLISNKASVSPRIFDGVIRADMPDRFDSYNNIVSNVLGTTVNFNPAFSGPAPYPNLQVSIQDAASGDYWEFISRDLESFTIRFYDNTNTAVVRTFDVAAKGYGRRALTTI